MTPALLTNNVEAAEIAADPVKSPRCGLKVSNIELIHTPFTAHVFQAPPHLLGRLMLLRAGNGDVCAGTAQGQRDAASDTARATCYNGYFTLQFRHRFPLSQPPFPTRITSTCGAIRPIMPPSTLPGPASSSASQSCETA